MTATDRAMCTEAEDRIRELEEELRIAAGINAQMIDERDTARTDHLKALQATRDLLHRDKTGVPLPFTRPAREYIDDAIDRLLRLPPASDEERRAAERGRACPHGIYDGLPCPYCPEGSTYEVVKMINGTWNVRDASTGDWVPDGVWLSKPDATALADRLALASRDSQQTEETPMSENSIDGLRDAAEIAVTACLPLLPLRGSWDSGYQLEKKISHHLIATPEEWAEAAHAIAALHNAIRHEPLAVQQTGEPR